MSLYKELLSKGENAIKALELPFKVKKEKKNLEMKILELEQEVAQDNLTLQEEKSKCPINWDKVIDAIDNLELNKRKLEQLENLQKELFIEE